jgi:histidinol phosphatase-like PHP family hydrolase
VVYDFHTHTFLSEGSLSPLELIYKAIKNNYCAIAITDHVGIGSLERIIVEVTKDCALAQAHWNIIAIPGVELTLVPAAAIAQTAKQAKELGARLVLVHGETGLESIEPGTNLAAVSSPHVDILAHPGLLSLREAEAAAANGVFIEVTARRAYSSRNGYITKIARLAGAKLLINSDAHDKEELLTPSLAHAIAQGAGLDERETETTLEANPRLLLQKLGLR